MTFLRQQILLYAFNCNDPVLCNNDMKQLLLQGPQDIKDVEFSESPFIPNARIQERFRFVEFFVLGSISYK